MSERERLGTWQLAHLAECGEPDRADVLAVPAPEVPADWAEQPLALSIVATIPERPQAVAFERATGDWLTGDDCERAGYWYPNADVIWLGRVSTCGTCGRSWDWGTPAARCPFEAFHGVDGDAGSAGAQFLRSIEDGATELYDSLREDYDGEPEDWADYVSQWADYSGGVHEITDGAVDIYTRGRWAQFFDLAAYDEEPASEGLTAGDEDMTQLAGICLYMIAERLAWALLTQWAEDDAETMAAA